MRQILEHDGYHASYDGKIYSSKTRRFLKPRKNRLGYLTVGISINGKKYTRTVHRLVALAFIPNPDNLPEINHKDGNKENNNVNNLEWSSRSSNQKHACDTGLQKPQLGSDHGMSKLKEKDIPIIMRIRSEGQTLRFIANMFNVDAKQIHRVVTGKSWTHVTMIHTEDV